LATSKVQIENTPDAPTVCRPPVGDAFVLGDVVSHQPETPLFWATWSATSRRRLCSGRRGQPPAGDAFVLGDVVSPRGCIQTSALRGPRI
ncbi:hypothetical protein LSAT2_009594, partial [Lamellibrachia satsuma]